MRIVNTRDWNFKSDFGITDNHLYEKVFGQLIEQPLSIFLPKTKFGQFARFGRLQIILRDANGINVATA